MVLTSDVHDPEIPPADADPALRLSRLIRNRRDAREIYEWLMQCVAFCPAFRQVEFARLRGAVASWDNANPNDFLDPFLFVTDQVLTVAETFIARGEVLHKWETEAFLMMRALDFAANTQFDVLVARSN